jgi:translocation and assembly module TamB
MVIAAALRWQMIDGEWSGSGNVRGTLAEIEFDQFLEAPYAAKVSGTFIPAAKAGPSIDALVSWENWVIDGRTIKDCEVRVHGGLDGYDLQYDATAQLTAELQLAVSGTATGTRSGLDQVDASLVNSLGRIEARGSVLWEPVLQILADVTIIEADAGVLAPGLPSGIGGNVHLQYSDDAQLNLDGRLSDGENELRVKGRISSDELSMALGFDVPNPALLVNDLSGALSGNAMLSGTPANPVLSLNIRGEDLRQTQSSAPAVDLGLSGTLRRTDCGWSSLVESASISAKATGSWTLTKPAAAQFCDGALSVAAHEWTGDNGDVRVDRIEAGKDTIAVVAGIDRLPLSLADAWLPPDVRLLGTANAEIDLERSGNDWSGTASWHQSDTVLRVTPPGETQADIHIPRASAEARLERGGLFTKVEIAVEPGVTGTLDLELAELTRDSRLSARLLLQGEEWQWVSFVIPQIDQFKGSINADIAASGTVAAPDLSGTFNWNDGSLLVPALNVPLREINVVVEGGSNGTATLQGSARAGDGSLTFDGDFSELMRGSPVLRVHVGGEAAELLDWPEYHLWASPDIVVTLDSGGWRIEGEIGLPRADVEVSQLPEGAVSISPDVIVLGEEERQPKFTAASGEIRLTLGERVHINAFGLDSGLQGDLSLRKLPDRDLAAEGQISLVGGVFSAYGRNLTIRHGELTFTGPLDNPIVDVRAVREIETIDGTVTAGLHLTGRAQNITATVFSEPSMAEADALSYLVVGRPLNQATEAEGGDLIGAAVALGLKRADRLVEQIGRSMGLDQLSLTGDGGESTALVAGKQLNRRLYARYAYGVFSRLGTFLVRYRMTEKLTLEAASGETQAIDVLYTVEKE